MEITAAEEEEEEEEGAVCGTRDKRHVSLWNVEKTFSNASDIIVRADDSTEDLFVRTKKTGGNFMSGT